MRNKFILLIVYMILMVNLATAMNVSTELHFIKNVNGNYPLGSIGVDDINNDGYTDFVTCYYGGDKIVSFSNNGSEYFTESVIDTNKDGCQSILMRDVDKDNYPDFIVWSPRNTDKFELYGNNGDGTFANKISEYQPDVYTGNFLNLTGNENIDYISGNWGGSGTQQDFYIYDSNYPTFNSWNKTLYNSGFSHINKVIPLDFNKDGFDDFFSCGGDNTNGFISGVRLNENDGFGNFNYTQFNSSGCNKGQKIDWNNDGWDDVVLLQEEQISSLGYNIYHVVLWLNNQDNSFIQKTLYNGVTIYNIAVADIDNNGYDDIVYNSKDYRVGFIDNIDGLNYQMYNLSINPTSHNFRGMGVGDIDTDGDTDIVLSDYDGHNLYFLENKIISPSPNPSLLLNSDLKETKNYNKNQINITINGTLTNYNSDIFNCSLYNSSNVLQSYYDLNLSNNNLIQYDLNFMTGELNLNISCENYENYNVTDTYNYKIDRQAPFIFSDYVNNSVKYIQDIDTFYFNVSDDNLYAHNETLFCGNNIIFNNFYTNVTYNFFENETKTNLSFIGNCYYNVEAWDSHTKHKIKNYKIEHDVKNKNYKINDEVNIIYDGDISFIKNFDKYEFNISSKNKKKFIINFNTTDDIKKVENSKYKNHYVIGYKYWIDFVSDDISNVKILKHEKNLLSLEITKKNINKKNTYVHSIGELNYNFKHYFFTVENKPIDSSNTTSGLSYNESQALIGIDSTIKNISKGVIMMNLTFLLIFVSLVLVFSEFKKFQNQRIIILLLGFVFSLIGMSNSIKNDLTFFKYGFFLLMILFSMRGLNTEKKYIGD